MLYIVAIAFCLNSTPSDECDNTTARQIERLWVYRPSVQDCVDYATEHVMQGDFDRAGRYPKVFCMRAETFEQAYSKVMGFAR